MGSQVPFIDELDTYLDVILHGYLTQWFTIFFMLTMLFYSLDHDHANKDF